MIDAYELLRTKENDLARVRREIESLRIVATLISETNETKASERDDDGRRTVVQLDSSDGKRGRPPKVRADVKRIGFRIGRPTFLSWSFASGESVVGPPADTADIPLRSGQ
jgi:hypothetical protein